MAKQVLVVEDDTFIRMSLVEILEEAGYLVFGAGNGQEAMNYLKETLTLPSLILLDIMMPVMDGWQFKLEQEKDPVLNKIPVVVVTADGNAQEKAKKIKAESWVKKPIEINALLKTIETCCA